MTVFRAELLAIAALALLVSGGLPPAVAQATKPGFIPPTPLAPAGPALRPAPPITPVDAKPLAPTAPGQPAATVTPAAPPAAPPAPLAVAPAADDKPPISTETAKPGEVSVTPVSSGDIKPIQLDSLGSLGPAQGGFGAQMWAGTRRDLVEALLPRVPAATTWPELRELRRRLLVSAATPPEGEATAKENLLVLRIGRLYDAADFPAMLDLVRVIPSRALDDALAEKRVNALLATDDVAAACLETRARLARKATLFWEKALVLCDAAAKEQAKAQLGAALVRDQDDQDKAFLALAEALTGNDKVPLDSLARAAPLHLAMARAAGRKLPEDTGPRDQPAMLVAIAFSPNAPEGLRHDAAHRAAQMGALSTGAFTRLLLGIDFKPDQVKNAAAEAERLDKLPARALLLRAAEAADKPAVRAEALAALLRMARRDGDYLLMARVAEKLVMAVAPSGELAAHGAELGRALYATGNPGEAKAWFDLLAREAAGNTAARAGLPQLWPVARIAGGDAAAPWDGERFAAWQEQTEMDEAGVRRTNMLLTLLDGFGDPIVAGDWKAVMAEPAGAPWRLPPPHILFALREASAAKRVGETVLLALVAFGDAPPQNQHPALVATVVTALKAAGLEREARQLALEAAVATGI